MAAEAPVSEFATRAKVAWVRLLRKGYEADPLACRSVKSGPMRVIALIDDPGVVRRIRSHRAMTPRLFRIRATLT